MSYLECQEFCAKLTAHLGGSATLRLPPAGLSACRQSGIPTEAEWEYACRAGTTTHYHFGDVLNAALANYNGAHTRNGSPKGKNRPTTTDLGTFPPNPWGLSDLHGNVWEWCADPFRPYSVEEQSDNNKISNNNTSVVCGGSWLVNPRGCRAANRRRSAPAGRSYDFGFRIVGSVQRRQTISPMLKSLYQEFFELGHSLVVVRQLPKNRDALIVRGPTSSRRLQPESLGK